ncbi:MAG TPA: hypothetical protein VK935_02240 [Actinomycetospora sp.]|nr:hypothetical protein [Actinomycetospora sp.]
MDEDESSSGGVGPTVGTGAAPSPEHPAPGTHPPLPERARYRPLRGLDELLDDFLRGPAAPG